MRKNSNSLRKGPGASLFQNSKSQGLLGVGLLVTVVTFTALGSCFGENETPNPVASQLSGKSCALWEEGSQIPHLHADDELTALACMGYVHARDRAWQMDFLRRTAEGRTAEVLGKKNIAQDFQLRLMGLSEESRRIFAAMNTEQKARFWAYAYGVNRGFSTPEAENSYEFKSLDYQPERWKPEDSLKILLLQSLNETESTFQRKISEAGWLKQFQAAAPALFARGGTPWTTTILKPGEYKRAGAEAVSSNFGSTKLQAMGTGLASALSEFFTPTAEPFRGSNNWVLAASRSRSGHAWFANDPHLDLDNPSFWYWVHVSAGPLDAIGASVPGTPTIPSGVNEHLSWGLTDAYLDVSDLALVPTDELKDAPTFRPTIWFRVGTVQVPFFLKTFQRTRQGWPVLPLSGLPSGKALVLHWTGHDLGPADFDGMFDIMKAGSVGEADIAVSHVGLPTWNFVFADDQGRIGYRASGKVIEHESALPFGIEEKTLAQMEQLRLLPAADVPHVLEPERGYVVTANNRHWPKDAAYNEGRAYAAAFRAHRIEELLMATPQHDLESIRRVQCDVQSQEARYMLSSMVEIVENEGRASGGLSSREMKAIELLLGWDFESHIDCKACAIFERWTGRILDENGLNPEALYRALTSLPLPQLPGSVLKNFRAALDDLKMGEDGQIRAWGELHRAPFTHLSGLKRFMNGSIGTPGMSNTVNVGTSKWDASQGLFIHTIGPSQRLIVEMTQPPTIYQILPGTERDMDRPEVSDPSGPWMKWERCELERRAFPLNWSQVPATRIVL